MPATGEGLTLLLRLSHMNSTAQATTLRAMNVMMMTIQVTKSKGPRRLKEVLETVTGATRFKVFWKVGEEGVRPAPLPTV